MELTNTLGARVEKLLQALKISAATLTRNLGRKHNYVGNIVNGCNKNPNEYFFEYLQVRYNVNPDWLKSGRGEMFLSGGKKDCYSSASIIEAINKLGQEDQQAIRNYIEALSLRQRYIAGEFTGRDKL